MIKKIITAAISLALVISLVFISSAGNISDMQRELQQTNKEKSAITQKKKEAQKSLLTDKQYRDSIIADLEKQGYEKAQIEEQINQIQSAIDTLEQTIAHLQKEYDSELKLFQERIVTLYIQSRTNAGMDEILSSSDFDSIFRKVHMMKMISQFDQDLMKSLLDKQAEINELKAIKQREEENAKQQLEENLKKIEELQVSRSTVEEKIAESQQSIALLEKAEEELEKEAKKLGELIRRASSNLTYGGVMKWPTPGYYGISSHYGYRIHPILKYRKFHGGIDINAPLGAYIHAAADGKVIWSGWRSGGSGNTIIIDHGSGMSTLYLHIMNGGLLVKEGQYVKAGDVIAKVGSTGLSTGPHLHFEVRKNGERQNPLNYVTSKK
jgi:murein DD-endopeptidase MepM/ murein hydrolase activator NlpD